MPAEDLADLARDVFSDDQVHVAERLDDALDLAFSLADDADAAAATDGLPGSSAVLVTGSVVTAGDAQLLLAPASAVGRSANPRAPEPGTPARHSFTLGELS
jgi:hypothetical protein